MSIELLKQYVAAVNDTAAAIESGLDAKADALQSRIQDAIDRTHAKNAAALEEFRAKYAGIDQQAITIQQEIQSANALHPVAYELAKLQATVHHPIDLLQKLWQLQEDHPVHLWQERIALMRGAIGGYLKQIGIQFLIPSEWNRLTQTLVGLNDSRELMQLFHRNWREWQRLHWAIQDGRIRSGSGESDYLNWKKRMPVNWSIDRFCQSLRKLPPIVRDQAYLDPEYQQHGYNLVF